MQQRVDQLKMLDHHPLSLFQRLQHRFRQLGHLSEGGLKAHIQVIAVRLIKAPSSMSRIGRGRILTPLSSLVSSIPGNMPRISRFA